MQGIWLKILNLYLTVGRGLFNASLTTGPALYKPLPFLSGSIVSLYEKKNRLFLASAAAVITRPTFCKRRTGDYIQKKNPLEWPIQDDAKRIKGR